MYGNFLVQGSITTNKYIKQSITAPQAHRVSLWTLKRKKCLLLSQKIPTVKYRIKVKAFLPQR